MPVPFLCHLEPGRCTADVEHARESAGPLVYTGCGRLVHARAPIRRVAGWTNQGGSLYYVDCAHTQNDDANQNSHDQG